jgi:glycosyl transferase family 25
MTAQLVEMGVPFRFFDAERIERYPERYDARTRLRTYGNHLTLGEIGCYDSHYQIWQALAASNDHIWCVLEDDVNLSGGFATRLANALDVTTPWGIMRFTHGGSAGARRVGSLPCGAALHDYRKQPRGTTGYLIRRDAALTLLRYARTIVHPVDDMLNRYWEHGIRMISVSPDIVAHRDETLGGTTIHGRIQFRPKATPGISYGSRQPEPICRYLATPAPGSAALSVSPHASPSQVTDAAQ